MLRCDGLRPTSQCQSALTAPVSQDLPAYTLGVLWILFKRQRRSLLSERNHASPAVADYSHWQAQDYFRTYYSEVVLPDEQVVLAYQIETLKRIQHPFGRGLEYGCGPTLHRAIAAARYAFRIDMADWLPDTLAQVQEWVDSRGGNSDWNRFTHYILGCEGEVPDARRIERRE